MPGQIMNKIRKETLVREHRGTFVGTPLYVAPEMLYE